MITRSLEYAIQAYSEANPDSHMIAAEHPVGCACAPCICLAHTAASIADPDDTAATDWLDFVNVTKLSFPEGADVVPYVPESELRRYADLVNEL